MVDPVFPFFADTYWAYFYAWLTRIVPSNTIFLNDIYFLLSLCFLLWKFDINCKVAGWPTDRKLGVLGSAVETRPQPCASVRKWPRPLSWQYWLWSFRFGDAKLNRFLSKSEQILRKFGYFWNGFMPTKQKFCPFLYSSI